MALKQKIDKAAFDALPDAIKTEYKLVGTDYVLDLEGYEDPGELRRARDREKQEAAAAKAALKAAQDELNTLKTQGNDDAAAAARKAGDIAALEASWKTQRETSEAALKAQISAKDGYIQTQLVDSVAHQIAADIAVAPSVLLPHIKARLVADLSGPVPVTRVIDAAGKPSALTVAELAQEFVANKEFSAIIKASSGSGGGAPGGKQGSGGSTKKFAELSGTERAEYLKRDPAGFAREAAAAKAAGPNL